MTLFKRTFHLFRMSFLEQGQTAVTETSASLDDRYYNNQSFSVSDLSNCQNSLID